MKLSRILAVVLASAVLAVAGCGGSGSDTRAGEQTGSGERMKPLVDQFKDARARAKSDFERQVLDRAIETGKIDPADYEEAFARYRRCVEDAGIKETYTKLPNGLYRITPPTDLGSDQKAVDGYMKTTGDCAQNSGLMSIEALYTTQIGNPDMLADPKLVVVRCLVKAGLVPPDYTVEKLDALLRNGFANSTDFDPMSDAGQQCLAAGGMAVNTVPSQSGDQGPNNQPGQGQEQASSGPVQGGA